MKKRVCYALIVFVCVLGLIACDEFFSTTLGSPRSYDLSKISITPGNAEKWFNLALGNPDLMKALLEKYPQELAKYPLGSPERAELLAAAAKLAVESSGVGKSILTEAMGLIKDLDTKDPDETTIKDILNNIQKNFDNGSGPDAAASLAQMVSSSISTEGTPPLPKFDGTYADMVDTGDMAGAMLVLVLGAMNEIGATVDTIDTDWNNVVTLSKGLTYVYDGGEVPHVALVDPPPPSEEPISPVALAMAAYLNLIADSVASGDNPLTNTIKDAYLNRSNP